MPGESLGYVDDVGTATAATYCARVGSVTMRAPNRAAPSALPVIVERMPHALFADVVANQIGIVAILDRRCRWWVHQGSG